MLFIDLDDFKAINDTAGHEAGDFVLTEVAERLKTAIRLSDTAARIIAFVSRPIVYLGRPLSVGASIGIGLFPDHATDARSLRRAADSAMYAAKRRGTNSFAFAEPGPTIGADHDPS